SSARTYCRRDRRLRRPFFALFSTPNSCRKTTPAVPPNATETITTTSMSSDVNGQPERATATPKNTGTAARMPTTTAPTTHRVSGRRTPTTAPAAVPPSRYVAITAKTLPSVPFRVVIVVENWIRASNATQALKTAPIPNPTSTHLRTRSNIGLRSPLADRLTNFERITGLVVRVHEWSKFPQILPHGRQLSLCRLPESKDTKVDNMFTSEPPWVCRRLQPLRDWSHDESEKVLPRGAGAGGSDGVRARERVLLAVGCHPVYCRKDRLLW